ncbi:MAG: hypothetical protein AMJ73_03810 [candidate division Zixibacteria bacterium SM1_73]|nr:MAG: hypothetical protein AMJ73_03810 [candidate division Zixibacteria bacterium SM1_73]
MKFSTMLALKWTHKPKNPKEFHEEVRPIANTGFQIVRFCLVQFRFYEEVMHKGRLFQIQRGS